ncbi:hypothetical protein EDD17DRAFT_174415 [Pisolithus thermaeus]|nr:hypothetical protein EV401DRAFT_2209581 [Pisolithus croceorrhizus]KAI6165622.1 hypothetical protein EDD17DRAFT_174415 [Pisolithus thermaeus]
MWPTRTGTPPSLFKTQQWEIIPSGDGFMIQNVQTRKYLSFQTLSQLSPIVATSYPTAWHFNRVYLPDENAVFYEIRWPHSSYVFDLAGGDSTPNTRIQIIDQSLEHHPGYDRRRLWRALFYRSASTTAYHHMAATTFARPQLHTISQSHTFKSQPQQAIRGSSSRTVVGNERRKANMADSGGPVPPPLTSVRSSGRTSYKAPRGTPPQSKQPTAGIGTSMHAAHRQAPGPLAPQINGRAASHMSSVDDSEESSFATAVEMNSGPDAQDAHGWIKSWKDDGRHVAALEGKGGGGLKRFLSWLIGGRTDKAGRLKKVR